MQADYIDHMGTDSRVVDSARVSFAKEASNFTEAQNEKLIHYLARCNHWSPFSHCTITLRETVPIFVARQRFKHMVGFSYNEVSRRYVDDTPEFYVPEVWRKRAENIKQGSSEEVIEGLQPGIDNLYAHVKLVYERLIYEGVAPEQARIILPQSMYTSYYVTGSLAAWARAYKLRIDPHAQKEIQDLAHQWGTIIQPLFPVLGMPSQSNAYDCPVETISFLTELQRTTGAVPQEAISESKDIRWLMEKFEEFGAPMFPEPHRILRMDQLETGMSFLILTYDSCPLHVIITDTKPMDIFLYGQPT